MRAKKGRRSRRRPKLGKVKSWRGKSKFGRKTRGKKGFKRPMKKTIARHVKQDTDRSSSAWAIRRGISTKKLATMGMMSQYYRLSGLYNYEVAGGFHTIANRVQADGTIFLPAHVWDISCLTNSTQPTVGHGLKRNGPSSIDEAGIYNLNMQDPAGNFVAYNNYWQAEDTTGGVLPAQPTRKALQEYVQLGITLYGCRKITTTFKVQWIRMLQPYADFISASGTSQEKREMYDAIVKDLLFNPLNLPAPRERGNKYKVMKQEIVTIDQLTTEDQGPSSEGANPRTHTLKWFLKLNAIRHFDWNRGGGSITTQAPAWPNYQGNNFAGRVDPRFRDYILISAISPLRKLVSEPNEGTDLNTEPSYDIVLRSKWQMSEANSYA